MKPNLYGLFANNVLQQTLQSPLMNYSFVTAC